MSGSSFCVQTSFLPSCLPSSSFVFLFIHFSFYQIIIKLNLILFLNNTFFACLWMYSFLQVVHFYSFLTCISFFLSSLSLVLFVIRCFMGVHSHFFIQSRPSRLGSLWGCVGLTSLPYPHLPDLPFPFPRLVPTSVVTSLCISQFI